MTSEPNRSTPPTLPELLASIQAKKHDGEPPREPSKYIIPHRCIEPLEKAPDYVNPAEIIKNGIYMEADAETVKNIHDPHNDTHRVFTKHFHGEPWTLVIAGGYGHDPDWSTLTIFKGMPEPTDGGVEE